MANSFKQMTRDGTIKRTDNWRRQKRAGVDL